MLSVNERRAGTVVSLLFVALGVVPAQRPSLLPPIRPLGRVTASIRDSLHSVQSVREISGGRVLVQDPDGMALVLYDTTLTRGDTILGGSGPAARAYPTMRSSPMIAWRADSTILADYRALAFLVIDPSGRVARTTALPPGDIGLSIGTGTASDLHGRIALRRMSTRMDSLPDPLGKGVWMYVSKDSDPIVRVDVESHRIDSIAYVKNGHNYLPIRSVDPEGTVWDTPVQHPLRQPDGWAILSDGTIAIVRAQDYHIDWIRPDGTRTTSLRIAHDWYKYSDSERVAIVDSVQKVAALHPSRQTAENDTSKRRSVIAQFPNPDDLPTYETPFVGPIYADADNHLWIREKRSEAGAGEGPVYEIIDRVANVVARVRVPGGTTIVGFGHGVVYLSSREGAGASLVRFAVW